MSKNIKAIVFDFGGVIELYDGDGGRNEVATLLGMTKKEFMNEYFKHNHLSNVANMPWEDMINEVVSALTNDQAIKDQARAIIRYKAEKRTLNQELLSLIPILKQQDFKIGMLSNSDKQLRQRINDYNLAQLFDVIAISGEIGHQKPHQEAFQILFDQLQVQPAEVIFIDDATKSLEKAKEIGYLPILFRSNEQLKIDLKKMDIVVD